MIPVIYTTDKIILNKHYFNSIAVYCSVQLCVALYSYVLVCIALYSYVSLCIAMYGCVLLCIAVYCSVQLRIAVYSQVQLRITVYDVYIVYIYTYSTIYIYIYYNYGDYMKFSILVCEAPSNNLDSSLTCNVPYAVCRQIPVSHVMFLTRSKNSI